MDVTTVGNVEPQVDTLINGKTRHQAMLVIDMRTQRAHTVGRKNMILHKKL